MPTSRCSDSFKARKNVVAISEGTVPFLQTFEKSTQIYRYLKTRFISSPLYLQRNLSYMKGRITRNSKRRKDFKVEKILSTKMGKENGLEEKLQSNENLIIAFICFNDEVLSAKNVKVETKLEKISHKRRKEGTSGNNKTRIGESVVIVNSEDNGTEKLPAVCVSNSEFDRLGDNVQLTYQLTFDIEAIKGRENGNDEPPKKTPTISKQYHAELPVFDKAGRNLLLNGLYHVTALDKHHFQPSQRLCWESFASESDQHIADWAEEVNKYYFSEEDSNPFATFEKTPKIQLYMEWTPHKISGNNYITRPKFINDRQNNNKENNNGSVNAPPVNGHNGNSVNGVVKSLEVPKTFCFQFVVNNSTKQRTEERNDFVCPWCTLNCMRMYSLMKHLKLSHARLLFQYIDEGTKGRIDVYVNDLYDGSYSGAPHDVLLGLQRGPTRRNVVTNIMVFRPRKPTFNMNEFQEADDGELDQQRQYISGHNRIYYHSETCIPILPKELDYDSEGEPDPLWLQRTTKQMIDEFTDVNGGEKELMKLWNLHVMKHGFVGDCQISYACDIFLEQKGKELLEKNLFRNYCVHLHTLFNYGLISPRSLYKNIKEILQISSSQPETVKHLEQNRQQQIKMWVDKNPAPEKTSKKLDSPTKIKSARQEMKLTAKALPKAEDAANSKSKGVKRKSSA